MGDVVIMLILVASFLFAWYMPATDRRDEFMDARVFWWAVTSGVLASVLAWAACKIRDWFVGAR